MSETGETVAGNSEPTIFDMFETDVGVETKGVTLRYGKNIKITVARAGGSNTKYEKLVRQLTKPYRQMIAAAQSGNGTEQDSKVIEGLLQEAYSKAVVLSWAGVTERDGTPITFTPENVVDLFKRVPALWSEIQSFASNFVNFLSEDTDAVVKN